jgi:DNA-binding CsgD family transcriptional regulator/tetratricopeptide (TPR) repeat protein
VEAGSTGVVSPVFVGRNAELAVARAGIDRALNRDAGLLLVAGEAGVGKTRLVHEAAAYARRQGVQVLSGHCVQLGTEGLPFAPIAEALRELIRDTGRDQLDRLLGPARQLVARLIPSVGEPAEPPNPLTTSQLLELVLGLIERLSADRPLLLIIEDLHWADRSTLELATFLAQNLRGVPVAMVITYRSDEVDRRHPLRVLLSTWERMRTITRLELDRFDRDEVRAQLTGILGADPDPETLELVFERSDGNAFLTEEMLSVVRSGARGLPPSLKDVLLARVDQLSEGAAEALRVAAVAGRSVPERLLVAVSELDELAVLNAVREAVDAHLLVVDEAGYTFRHALARDAVYDDLLPGERVRLHSAYAEALAHDPELLSDTHLSVAATLAHHSYAALDLPRAFEASLAAGREATAGLAPREALTHYERALLIWPRVTSEQLSVSIDQPEVLLLAGEAAYWAGSLDRSRSLLGQAIAELPPDAPPDRRALIMSRWAQAARDLGHLAEASDMLQRALALLPETPATEMRADVLASLSNGLMRTMDFQAGDHYAQLAVATAREANAPVVEADAQITLGYCRAYWGNDRDGGIAAMRDGLNLALVHEVTAIAMRGYINLSDLMEALGRSRDAVTAATAGLDLAQSAGLVRTMGTYLTGNLAEALMHLGEWDRAQALIDNGMRSQPEGIFEATLQILQAELSLLTGDLEGARSAVTRTAALVTDPFDDQFMNPLATFEAELKLASGDFAAATGIVLEALERSREHASPRYVWPLLWTGLRIDVERSLADPAQASINPRVTEPVDTAVPTVDPDRAYQLMCKAERARLTGTADWVAAIEVWRAVGWPWPLAYTLLRQAEQDGATEALREAWTIAARLGARPLISRAEQLAAHLRVDLAALGTPPEPSDNPLDALNLTAREQEVLLLVAAGRSNPEIAQELFISPKTASVHVSNILAKLGLSSRVQAATLVHRLGLGS